MGMMIGRLVFFGYLFLLFGGEEKGRRLCLIVGEEKRVEWWLVIGPAPLRGR
jgi:hypothetical protein